MAARRYCLTTIFLSPSIVTAPSRKVNPYAKGSKSTPGPSGLKVGVHEALNNVKPSTPTTAASGGNETETPTCGSSTRDAFAKFRAMVSQPTCACLAEAF